VLQNAQCDMLHIQVGEHSNHDARHFHSIQLCNIMFV
jgi:hypothetical protein